MVAEVSLQAAPFADDFVDVAVLNADVTASLLTRLETVRASAAVGRHVASKALAILGSAGSGKTHLFARLRHRPGLSVTLVLLRPYFGVNLTLRDVLAVVVDQLCLPVRGAELSQLDLITAHWLRADDDPTPLVSPSVTLAERRALDAKERADQAERAVRRVVELLPEVAPAAHLIAALFQTNERDAGDRWAQLAWLSGREPRPGGEASAALPMSERDVLHMLRILSVLAAPVAPIMLTFDQLENLAGDDDARVLGYGNLVSEIIDSVPCLTIVQLALTSEWMQFIEPRLSLPQKTRVAHDVMILRGPDRPERELLLRAWHERLMSKSSGGRKKRFPNPLAPDDLETLLTAPGMTPRLLLSALSRVVAGQPMSSARPVVEIGAERATGSTGDDVWSTEIERVRRELETKEEASLPYDARDLAEGLSSALSFVPNLEVTTRTEKDRVLSSVKAPGHELTIVYLTSLHPSSVKSALSKAIDLAQATKLVVLREKRFELPRTWESVREKRGAFERLPNARWLWLEREDVIRCVALARLFSQTRAKKIRAPGSEMPLSVEELRMDVARAHDPKSWEAVASISRWLSDVPRDARCADAPRSARLESAPTSTSKKAPAPFAPGAAVRTWMALGRSVGRAAISHYIDKIRDLARRT